MGDKSPGLDFDVRLKQWIRYELAARKIQRNYRQWRQYYYTYRRIKINSLKRLNRSYDLSYKYSKVDRSRHVLDNFQAVIQQNATFDNKCAFWRKLIDLKKAFPDRHADVIIRAMIEANGDMTRSTILLGSKEFLMQNSQSLPSAVKSVFIPFVGPFNQQASNYDAKFIKTLFVSTNKFGNSSASSMGPSSPDKRGRNTDFIRSLRNQHVQRKKQELMDTFMRVIEKSYFYAPPNGKPPAGLRGTHKS